MGMSGTDCKNEQPKGPSPGTAGNSDPPGPLLHRALAVAILTVHVVQLLIVFGGPRNMVSEKPLLHIDHSWHFYYCVTGSRSLREHGSTAGYDPKMMAGYPTDVIDTSDRSAKVGMALLNFLAPEVSYKLIIFATGAVVPLLFYAVGLFFQLGRTSRLLCAAGGTLAWWLGGGFSTWFLGMFGFSLACTFGLFLTSLFYRFIRFPSRGAGLALLAAAPLALVIHPGIVLIVVVPCLAVYLFRFRKIGLRVHAFIFFVVAIAVAANLFWILPTWANLVYTVRSDYLLQDPTPFITRLLFGNVSKLQFFLPLLPLLAVPGLVLLWKEGRRGPVLVLTTGAAWLFFVFFAGRLIPGLGNVQPVRYGIAALLFLAVPASRTLEAAAGSLFSRQPPRRIFRALSLLCLVLLVPSAAALFSPSLLCGSEKLPMGMTPAAALITDWVGANTSGDARVMLQERTHNLEFYGKTFATSTVAHYTEKEIIGGPYWGTFIKHHTVNLDHKKMLGRDLESWNEKSLREAMDVYNVGWAVAFSERPRAMFDSHPEIFTPMNEGGGFRFYRVNRGRSFFLEGAGKVKASLNRIELRDIETSTGRVVISYHWHHGLRASPPARIHMVPNPYDPVGFIGIDDPPSELTITFSPWRL